MENGPLASPLGDVVDILVSDPIFAGLVVVMLLFVFFAYLFVRRTLTGLQEGYDDAYRDR